MAKPHKGCLRPVKTQVDAPNKIGPKRTRPDAVRPKKLVTGGREMARGNAGNRQIGKASSVLGAAARQFNATAASYETKGNTEIRAEAYEMRIVVQLLAGGIRSRAEWNKKKNIDPTLHAMYEKIASVVEAAANAAAMLGPTFDDLHRDLLNNLANGDAGWDTTTNTNRG
jgi:hypothetical protein